MTLPIQAVAFDWDGTLMDSKAALLASFHQASTELFGEPFPVAEKDIDAVIQLRAAEAFALITERLGAPQRVEELGAAFQRAYKEQASATRPFPGMLEALRQLREAGVKIGIATSKARARMDAEGDRTGISALVDCAITGDDVTNAKPDPEAVAAAIAGLGAEPGRTLYVGDGPNDIVAGRGAGAITVGVAFGFHPAQMRDERPDHVIETPSALVRLALSG